jgi:leader peptidase (prepilin peptidase)/N-methyltransferase
MPTIGQSKEGVFKIIEYGEVEALTGLLSLMVAYQLGGQIETLFALLLTWVLIVLSSIDFDHQLLPDNITLPVLWLGLLLSLFNILCLLWHLLTMITR